MPQRHQNLRSQGMQRNKIANRRKEVPKRKKNLKIHKKKTNNQLAAIVKWRSNQTLPWNIRKRSGKSTKNS